MLSTKKAIKKKKAKKKEKTLSTKKAIKKKNTQLKTVIAHPTNRAKYSFCLNF